MLALVLTLGMAVAGCNNSLTINSGNPLFVPVTGITGVPSSATAGTDLTLAGTVAPADATNKTIVWSVLGIGAGATIDSGTTLQTETWGRATVRATIVNGATASTNYIQTFKITVNPDFDRLSLTEFLAWLQSNAVDNGDYTYELSANQTINPESLGYGDDKTVKITLKGDATERTVSLESPGTLFTIRQGVTLTLDNNVTLQGRDDNTTSLVYVYGGTLAMKGNAKITGNTTTGEYASGGGVYVSSGSFTKTGGIIYGSNESDAALRNVVKNEDDEEQTDKGAAIWADYDHRRETTVGTGQDIYASYSGNQWTYTGQ
jgi:hypothetical protein